jgi:hypothetical protein
METERPSMDSLDDYSEKGPSRDTVAGLQSTVRSLRLILTAALISMLVLSGSMFVFLLREVSYVRRQITGLRQFIADYETKEVPVMEDFHRKLQAFARSHPDFTPVLVKHFGSSSLQVGQPAPTPAPISPAP